MATVSRVRCNSCKKVFTILSEKPRFKEGESVVIKGSDISDIMAISSLGNKIQFSSVVYDEGRDLAALRPAQNMGKGLAIDANHDLKVGVMVSTWGYPLGYNLFLPGSTSLESTPVFLSPVTSSWVVS